uniref:Uncharacterized protein n=1 Tax=mine drainage metagenome TaxID=410659 RepID=E6PPR0_9ZZZZ
MAIEEARGIRVDIARHRGNRSTGTWQDAQRPLWPARASPGASSCRPSAGLSSARMPGTSVRAASWHTMTVERTGPPEFTHDASHVCRIAGQPQAGTGGCHPYRRCGAGRAGRGPR